MQNNDQLKAAPQLESTRRRVGEAKIFYGGGVQRAFGGQNILNTV